MSVARRERTRKSHGVGGEGADCRWVQVIEGVAGGRSPDRDISWEVQHDSGVGGRHRRGRELKDIVAGRADGRGDC